MGGMARRAAGRPAGAVGRVDPVGAWTRQDAGIGGCVHAGPIVVGRVARGGG